MRLVFAAVGAALLFVTSAVAAPPTEAQWTAFLEASYSNYRQANSELTWEDRLFLAGKVNADRRQAMSVFAREIGAPVETAESYAEAIMAAVASRESRCEAPAAGCHLAPGTRMRELIESVALTEPSGQLMKAAGSNVGTAGKSQTIAFVDLARRHPRGRDVLAALFNEAEDPIVLGVLALDGPASAQTASVMGRLIDVDGGPEDWGGWQEAVLETAEARALATGASVDVQAAYAQTRLARLLALGMTEDALALWSAYPASVRELLPLKVDPCKAGRDRPCYLRSEAGYLLADDLAAALWAAGRREEARRVLERAAAIEEPRNFRQQQRLALLNELMAPRRTHAELFDAFVIGEPDAVLSPGEMIDGPAGWAFGLQGPAVRRLAAARLHEAGYNAIARMLTRDGPYHRWETDPAEIEAMDALLDAETRDLRLRWASRIDAAWAFSSGQANSGRALLGSPERAFDWREARLPGGSPAWGDRKAPDLPKHLTLPVPAETVLRYEQSGAEHVVLFESSEFDLPGEIPAFGVWLTRTENGAWKPPVYLGLQQGFPYVVTPGSALPLLEGDRIRVEVNVREIDPASITFPPVGLTLKRSEDGVVLEASLAELERDADGDGLTDAAERRLGLDPANADSDGDELRDGNDPIPAVARKAGDEPGRIGLAGAIVKAVFDHDAGAIVVAPRPKDDQERGEDDLRAMLAGAAGGLQAPRMNTVFLVIDDPSLLAGLDLPFRLMAYTPDQAAALPTGGAPFFPPRIVDVLSSLDGRRHYVVWSAGWVGGSFLATCPETGTGPCDVKEVSGWIT